MKTYHANIDWADMPLTAEEEAGLIQGRENIKSGDFMTKKGMWTVNIDISYINIFNTLLAR